MEKFSSTIGLAKNTTEFITPSKKTKESLRMFGADSYISIVPTGIDFSLFQKQNLPAGELEEIKKELNIKKDDFVFLILGRLAKEKSMDVSIKGISKFKKAHPDVNVKLVIVGMGPDYEFLKELVDECSLTDCTIFTGAKPAAKVPLYYNIADVYTSASLTETQGLTFMEAMASGAIVLARFDDNLAGTIDDNETGFFFTDEISFVKKAYQIYRMSDKEKEQIRNNAYKNIEQYSIETFYENIMETYRRGVKSYW